MRENTTYLNSQIMYGLIVFWSASLLTVSIKALLFLLVRLADVLGVLKRTSVINRWTYSKVEDRVSDPEDELVLRPKNRYLALVYIQPEMPLTRFKRTYLPGLLAS